MAMYNTKGHKRVSNPKRGNFNEVIEQIVSLLLNSETVSLFNVANEESWVYGNHKHCNYIGVRLPSNSYGDLINYIRKIKNHLANRLNNQSPIPEIKFLDNVVFLKDKTYKDFEKIRIGELMRQYKCNSSFSFYRDYKVDDMIGRDYIFYKNKPNSMVFMVETEQRKTKLVSSDLHTISNYVLPKYMKTTFNVKKHVLNCKPITYGDEFIDYIGYNREYGTVVVHVFKEGTKESKEKFLRDLSVVGCGVFRFILSDSNTFRLNELPKNWGLLEVHENGIQINHNPYGPLNYLINNGFESDMRREIQILI